MKTEDLQHLQQKIKHLEDIGQDMDSVSWGAEEGILISGNDLKELLSDREELLNALEELTNQSRLLTMVALRNESALSKKEYIEKHIDKYSALIYKLRKQ